VTVVTGKAFRWLAPAGSAETCLTQKRDRLLPVSQLTDSE
jgi:hypothetical protein